MLRSMYSGISGLKNFQTKLDVIGNNIANVNTHGFKKGRAVFKDIYSQTVSGAAAPANGRGGVNPKQVGLGAQLSTVDTIHAGGSLQFTGNTLDLAIEGDGYFEVGTENGEETYYTRAGNFYLDEEGHIVNAEGYFLKNSNGGIITVDIKADTMSVGNNGQVTQVINGQLENVGEPIRLVKFNNPGGLEKMGSNYYLPSASSGEAVNGTPQTDGAGKIQSGSLEMSNVDLGEEFTEMIVAQRGFQANTRVVTTSDEILQELVNLKR
ncbi:flagellar basal body rod protein FlgG [Planococcaceae bacterium Storch 2/2-2]|nr:flagellar basal body rod protein FlgG [Planococcaceae bacterium Storch 2/2-2]